MEKEIRKIQKARPDSVAYTLTGSSFEKINSVRSKSMEAASTGLLVLDQSIDDVSNNKLFASGMDNKQTTTRSKKTKAPGSQKTKTSESKNSKLSLTSPEIPLTSVDFKQKGTVQDLETQLKENMKKINKAFNQQFGSVFGKVNFQKDILSLFQNGAEDTYSGEVSNKNALDGLLDALDVKSQRKFLMDFIYPAMTIFIQLDSIGQVDKNKKINSRSLKAAMQRTANPAPKHKINQFKSNDDLINIIRLSLNGLPTNGRCEGNRSPSMLSAVQLDALSKMKAALTEGKTTTVKLGAGEGKTFLSMLLPHVLGNADQPIIHVAPFAQDEEGWRELPDNLSDMEPGVHYWVRQDQLQKRFSDAETNQEDLSALKDAALFMDEYDRAPELNKALDTLGAMRRVNMSATDNDEVREKLNNYTIKTENIFGKILLFIMQLKAKIKLKLKTQ